MTDSMIIEFCDSIIVKLDNPMINDSHDSIITNFHDFLIIKFRYCIIIKFHISIMISFSLFHWQYNYVPFFINNFVTCIYVYRVHRTHCFSTCLLFIILYIHVVIDKYCFCI